MSNINLKRKKPIPTIYSGIIYGMDKSETTVYGISINGTFNIHRIDGPAIIHPDGTEAWFYMNQHITCKNQKEFERILFVKAFW